MLTLVETCQKVNPHFACCSPVVVSRKLRRAFFCFHSVIVQQSGRRNLFFFPAFDWEWRRKRLLPLYEEMIPVTGFCPLGGKHAVFLGMLSFSSGICQIQRDDMSVAILFPLPFIVIVKRYALFIFSDSGSGAIYENVHIESSRRVVNVDRGYDETSHSLFCKLFFAWGSIFYVVFWQCSSYGVVRFRERWCFGLRCLLTTNTAQDVRFLVKTIRFSCQTRPGVSKI